MKRLWKVTLGRNGEQEAHALETGELMLGFQVKDLLRAKDRDAVLAMMSSLWPNSKPKSLLNFAAQLNQFANTIQPGDLVVVPLKTDSKVAIGEVTGPCSISTDGNPIRPVKWLKTDVPREVFRQDLLYSFGAFMTVCEISRNDALSRVLKFPRFRGHPNICVPGVHHGQKAPTLHA